MGADVLWSASIVNGDSTKSLLRPVRPPVKYPVRTTSPVRIAAYNEAPFRIINLSTTATVWVSNDPGVRVNFGTPIYPGVSLQWVQNSQAFAIGDANADILVTTEIDDWQGNPVALATSIAANIYQQGIVIVDKPVQLFIAQYTGFYQSAIIDVSGFQSLNIGINLVAGASGGNDHCIDFEFFDGQSFTYRTSLVFSVVWQWWTGSIPCYSGNFRFVIPNNARFVVSISGSNRIVQQVRQRLDCPTEQSSTDLLYESVSLTGVNSTVSYDIQPWHGRVSVDTYLTVSPAVAPGTSNISIYQKQTGQILRLGITIFSASATNGSWWVNDMEFQLNGAAFRVLITNATASTISGQLRVTPITGALV